MKSRPRSLIAHLVRVVSFPHGVQHRLRTLLTVVGVALGVAAVTAVADVSESVLASFQHMVQVVAGDAELEVTSPGGTLDENLVEKVAAVPGVRAAAGVLESFVALAGAPEQSLYVLGVDFLGSPVFEAQLPRASVDIPDETVFVAQPDSVAVTEQLAQRLGLDEGGTLRVTAPGGERSLRVRGMVRDAAPARLFDGAMLLMDLPGAQLLLGHEGRVDRIAVQLARGAQLDDVRTRLAATLGSTVQVATPDARGQESESLLWSLRTMLATMSALAVIVGVLIVFQTVAVSVQQRRREFAMLNAVGVGRRTLMGLCLAETAAIATIGIAIGLATGRLIATLASRLVGNTASEIWLAVDVTQQSWSRTGTATAVLVGFATSLGAAFLAVRATFRAPTVEALRPAGFEADDAQSVRGPVLLAAALIAASWIIILSVPPASSFLAIVTGIIASDSAGYAAAAILAPVIVWAVGRALRPLAPRVPSLPARLAVENLPRSPGRSGATVATIAVTMAMAVIVTALVGSFERGVFHWMEQHFAADLFVGAGTRVRLFGGVPMDETIRAKVARIPGVAAIEPFRILPIRVGGLPAYLHGIDVGERLRRGGVTMVEGDFATAAIALTDGSGALVSDNLAYKLSLHRGDPIELDTPQGRRSFRVAGVFLDYLAARDLGAVAVADGLLATVWNDRLSDLFRVWLEPGASVSAVRADVLAALGAGYYAITTRQFLDGVRSVTRQFFLATWALQLVAALVGVIGVVNAQLATVLDRANEISVLHTIGVATRDLTRSVILECGALGAIGGLTGLALGLMLGIQFIDVSVRRSIGMTLPFTLPLGPVLVGFASAAIVSALAGWVPARAAARLESGQRSID